MAFRDRGGDSDISLKEAETIDNQEDESCKIDPKQEALQKKLSERTYLKRKIEEALEMMKGEGKEKINLTGPPAQTGCLSIGWNKRPIRKTR